MQDAIIVLVGTMILLPVVVLAVWLMWDYQWLVILLGILLAAVVSGGSGDKHR
jgi:hypothetical protein